MDRVRVTNASFSPSHTETTCVSLDSCVCQHTAIGCSKQDIRPLFPTNVQLASSVKPKIAMPVSNAKKCHSSPPNASQRYMSSNQPPFGPGHLAKNRLDHLTRPRRKHRKKGITQLLPS